MRNYKVRFKASNIQVKSKISDDETTFHNERSSKEESETKKRQEEFKELLDLLNKLKSRGIISAVQWRNYNRQWRESTPERKADLIQSLRYMLT